jgi:dTDP-4-dehydrorhamnose reductase
VKVLVTGRDGQLARGLLEAADGVDVRVTAVGRPELDVADERSVAAAISRRRADIVVNAAAYTAVDKAESEPAAAHAVNAMGAEHVARACAAQGIPIIHISTDYVFDGAKPDPYVEDDATCPVNVYGQTKLEGEQRVAAACKRHVVLRTAWVHSPWGANFVKTMLRLATTRPSIGVVGDQQGSPTYAPHLAAVVLAVASRVVLDSADGRWGVYHAVGSGETTWFGFAREIFRSGSQYGLAAAQVAAITTADFPTAARRPANSRLSSGKLRAAFGLELPDWRAGVRDCVARISTLTEDGSS